MPDTDKPPVAAGPAPVRTWRPVVFWTAGILLLAALAWFVGAVAVPAWQMRRTLADFEPALEKAQGVIRSANARWGSTVLTGENPDK